jgi:hypothetical protein
MITTDYFQLFKSDPNNSKAPKIVCDWVTRQEKLYPQIEFQIRFSERKSDEENFYPGVNFSKFERIYGPTLFDLRNIIFPLSRYNWYVRLIGNPKVALDASGLIPLLETDASRFEVIELDSSNTCYRGFTRIQSITPDEEEMIEIKSDRNINDEWEFRGTPKEFMDEVFLPTVN